jgi:hypothetical protein
MRYYVYIGIVILIVVTTWLGIGVYYSRYVIMDLSDSYNYEIGKDIVRFRTISCNTSGLWKIIYETTGFIYRRDHEISKIPIKDKSHFSYKVLDVAKAKFSEEQPGEMFDEVWLHMHDGGCDFHYSFGGSHKGIIQYSDSTLKARD